MNYKTRIIFEYICDIVIINLCSVTAVVLRMLPNALNMLIHDLPKILMAMPILSVAYIALTFCLKTYSVIWVFASVRDFVVLNAVCILSYAIQMACVCMLDINVIISTYPVAALLAMVCITGIRLIDRVWTGYIKNVNKSSDMTAERILVIGAGDAASILIRDICRRGVKRTVVVVDDDVEKIGRYIHECEVVGSCAEIGQVVEKYKIETIIFAIPSLNSEERARILNECTATGCEVLTMPSVEQVLFNKSVDLRKISIEDLLGREPVSINTQELSAYLSGKRVLVTGGGGSIGSELCRQITKCKPQQLIVFDIYENTAYELELELKAEHPDVDIVVLIGSVRDEKRLRAVFGKYAPQVVFHAAAHKHVPLMEYSPNEAIKNNVFGTLNTARIADEFGAERFVLISTDKAVNPTNIMGASKRLCEMIMQCCAKRSKTVFSAVRFGNVLGSHGSVIPLFKNQIEKGGPVTVTHPDIVRYFMTIPEAASLVLCAGAYATGGEVFVLNMGKPVRILDLAETLIRLSGHTPYKDIDIKFSGLRPGEKLFEELLMDGEGLVSTANKLIFVGYPMDFDEKELFDRLDVLRDAMDDENVNIRCMMRDLVPTYDMECKCNNNAQSEQPRSKTAVQNEEGSRPAPNGASGENCETGEQKSAAVAC